MKELQIQSSTELRSNYDVICGSQGHEKRCALSISVTYRICPLAASALTPTINYTSSLVSSTFEENHQWKVNETQTFLTESCYNLEHNTSANQRAHHV